MTPRILLTFIENNSFLCVAAERVKKPFASTSFLDCNQGKGFRIKRRAFLLYSLSQQTLPFKGDLFRVTKNLWHVAKRVTEVVSRPPEGNLVKMEQTIFSCAIMH